MDILAHRARLTPAKAALVYVPTGERFTYRALDERASRCAHALIDSCGIRPGDRVGILSDNRVEFVDAFFGAAKCGAILVPLSVRMTAHELEAIIRDSGPRCLLYSGRFNSIVNELRSSVVVERWIALDERASDSDLLYSDLARAASPAALDFASAPEDLHCLLYTSGTTGKPKGVMISHRMVLANAVNTVLSWEVRSDDVCPIFTPMHHAGGLFVFLAPIFATGGTIILHDGFDAAEVWRTIERERCTAVFGVPTTFKMMMDAPQFSSADLSSVRWFISGGAPLPAAILDGYQHRGVTFKQGYGLTEVGVNFFSMTAEQSRAKPGSIGKPIMFTEARLLDSEGKSVASGEVGELLLRGPHVCSGYWNNAQATAAALDRDGWFHTGDLARCDEDGDFYIVGRLKDMIISGGLNVYPAEIEAQLLQHTAIIDAAVIGVPHPTWGEVPVAFIIAQSNALTAAEIRELLSTRIAKYKIPADFVFVPEFPRTAYGKVIKPELRDSYLRYHVAKTGA